MKLQKMFFWATLCLILTGANNSYAQQLPVDPEVIVGKLPNGFTYYVRKNNTQKKRVVLFLVNKVGSILETAEQRGLAHFMEHMNFDGSTHFPNGTLVDFLEKAGVRFGADLNASTSFDQTVYQLPIPIDKTEMLNSGLQVIRDWAQEATLDPKGIEKERGVVLEEKRLLGGSQQRIQQQTFPYLVNHSRYADREPIGTDEVLKNFKRDTLISFYKDWYRPDLQAIIVVGDIDVKDVVAKIHHLFSDLKSPEQPKPRPAYTIDLNGKNQYLAVTDKEVQGTVIQIMIKYPHKKLVSHADYLDLVKRNLFNQVIGLRFQSVSRKNANSYLSANCGINPLIANIDAFQASIAARPGELEKGFAAFWEEINKIKTQGFTATELEMAKTQYLNAMQAAANEGDKKDSRQYAQEYVRHFLDEEASPGINKEAELTEAYLPTISLGHLNQMAKQFIGDTNRDVVIISPDNAKATLPDEQQVNAWFTKYNNTGTSAIIPDVEETALTMAKLPLIGSEPAKGKVVSTAKLKELNITELRMGNGVRIILKPTTFKNDEILFTAFSPGGTSIYPDKDYQSAANAASVIIEGGVGNFNADALREKLNGKRAAAIPFIRERVEGISGYSNGKDLETALQLTYLYFTAPRKDTAAFNANMSRLKASLSDQVSSPEKTFNDSLSAVLSNYSNRRKSPDLAQIGQISLDKALDIYQDRFKDAADFTFIMVGNFDPDKVQPLLERYLGSLPSINRKEEAKDLGIEIPKGVIKKTIYSGSSDKATVQLVISGDYVYNPENNTLLRAIKSIIQLRMIERLRLQESGVYSPGVEVSKNKSPKPRYAFFVQFGCAPENVDKLIAAAWDEISKLKSNGPSDDDLDKFLAEERVGIKSDLENNGFWLDYLRGQYQEQLDPKQILSFNSRLDSLTKMKLKDAINTYLKDDNYIRMVLMPQNINHK